VSVRNRKACVCVSCFERGTRLSVATYILGTNTLMQYNVSCGHTMATCIAGMELHEVY